MAWLKTMNPVSMGTGRPASSTVMVLDRVTPRDSRAAARVEYDRLQCIRSKYVLLTGYGMYQREKYVTDRTTVVRSRPAPMLSHARTRDERRADEPNVERALDRTHSVH